MPVGICGALGDTNNLPENAVRLPVGGDSRAKGFLRVGDASFFDKIISSKNLYCERKYINKNVTISTTKLPSHKPRTLKP